VCLFICFVCRKKFYAIYTLHIVEEQEISSRMDEQAQLQLEAAASRARAEANEKDLSEKQTKKLIKEYQKQVICQ